MAWSDVLRRVLQGVHQRWPGQTALGRASMARYLVHCIWHLRTFRDWFGHPRNDALQEALAQRPSLVLSVRRPYLSASWAGKRKLEVIRDHYALLHGPLRFLRFAPHEHIDLGNVGGLALRLDKPRWFEHEGELCLSLFDGETRLYSLVFTLGRSGTEKIAYVGALQGIKSPDALATYRQLTHRLHGLRPRDLLVAGFRLFCERLGIARILAVSDRQCVSRSRYFDSSPKVFAHYDQAWTENGGSVAAEGFFQLTPGLVHRDRQDIPSRKRAQYRLRYGMLDALAAQIAAAVSSAPEPRLVPLSKPASSLAVALSAVDYVDSTFGASA